MSRRISASSLGVSRVSPDVPVEVALMGMRFHVCVGILPHEREVPQPLELDVVVRHEGSAGLLDYRRLYELTRAHVETNELTYIEPLAEAIAAQLLVLDGVTWCRVAVRKPHVALGGPLLHAQVAVERSRG